LYGFDALVLAITKDYRETANISMNEGMGCGDMRGANFLGFRHRQLLL
jgi:hypothetical protein